MAEFSAKGWLPVDIDLDPQPGVVSEAPVRWIEFGSAPLAEPFFGQTADNLRQASPPAREIETDLETLVRIAGRLPAIRPSGFIFHISHCGSTLTANALKTADSTVVASEPLPVVKFARRFADPPGAYLAERWNRTRRTVLDSLFRLLATYRTGEPERLVIKFTSVNTICMRLVRSFWPETPCVMLIRDPVEVMVSALGEPGWMRWKEQYPDLARESFNLADLPGSVKNMSGEEYCGRILGRLFESALAAVDKHCKVIDYEDLSPRRVRDIAEFFGIELPGGEDLAPVFRVSAKDLRGSLPFQNDRVRKRALATSAINQAARQWALPGYSELRGSGFW
jgi:hypothetical protein